MKTFLAVYTGTPESQAKSKWNDLGREEQAKRAQQGIKAWNDWGVKHKDAIVAMGGPLGKTKRTGPDGVSDTSNRMAGYTLVRAETHEAAAKLFLNHPHFTIFPGEAVEVMEVMPVPNA